METELTEAFITEIYKRPPIWQSNHPQHKAKRVLKRKWEEIKHCCPGYEVDQLKKKWKNLKDAYRKEIKKNPKLRSGDVGTVADTLSQWRYTGLMMFMKDEFGPNNDASLDNLEIPDLYDSSRCEEQISLEHIILEPQKTLTSRSQQTDEEPVEEAPKKRPRPSDVRAQYLEIEKRKLKILEDEIARQNNNSQQQLMVEEKSEDYYYLMSLLPEMQKLPPLQKMRVRNRINEVLMDEMLKSFM